MLKSILLKFTENDDIEFNTQGVTIFVGPNNSGKSLILQEIENSLYSEQFSTQHKILKDFDIIWPDINTVEDFIKNPIHKANESRKDFLEIGRLNITQGNQYESVHIPSLRAHATEKNNKYWWAKNLLRMKVLRLDGRSRFNLTIDRPASDLLSTPQNILGKLFVDDKARKKISQLINDAFGLFYVIDPTSLGNFRIRLSKAEPTSNEQSLDQLAREFHKNATHILEASDGVQAYTGIITAILSGDFETILIDEPEAFLHPPLARKLGKHLTTITTESGGSLLASTHSSDFLMGCVQATNSVRVIRLEFSEGKSRGRMVDPEQLKKMFSNPLMRSTNAISGLFYDGVVVTESDNDRAFYGEIYYRLSTIRNDIPSILFINAQNKQTIKNIIEPLRKFGVPAAAIPDIDIVKDGGSVWTDWLASAQIPSVLHEGFSSQRHSINKSLTDSGKNMKSDGGVSILSSSDQLGAHQFFDTLAEYGVFVVRRGELENWLPSLSVTGKKTAWAVGMLERLGSDPTDSQYIQPSTDDVWEFMNNIVAWIKNPARKGTS